MTLGKQEISVETYLLSVVLLTLKNKKSGLG